ncbi:RNA polymerase recycling motor ATPase HelR [Microbacterium rhizomatis]|uniref:AAA family ATPase n=1 Tax=Microbacterium rhizomatis TaxID=1631477 RepID=A0A5J5J1T9_9MICO|nr:RNA polymerase recycling motor ATPase HelR [Microbacterium rhizomatis]KAA9107964.1 AAA family ATPase [Microbacterium rhizomatis]
MPAFTLPERLSAKADPALIADDEAHFAAIAATLDESITALTERLDRVRRQPARDGQEALDRDLEVHRLTSRLGVLRRFGLDLCLGRMVGDDGQAVYVGRLGLSDSAGTRLLVDWRSPAAEPFFGATHARPMGLVSRRRYRWTGGRIVDYWDEVFTDEGLAHAAALDDQSAFIASLGRTRSPQMHDVLGTIQADQDAIIRAGSRGALVVDGGPGTGKTVVALHRTAYLLYADPRLNRGHGGVLFVGPHEPYLAYVDDVLPRLGEDGVRICTLRDLVPEGRTAGLETDPEVARLKASARLVDAVESAARLYEQPPTDDLVVETPWIDLRLGADDWAEAFTSAEPGASHDDAREQVWQTLIEILTDSADGAVPASLLHRAFAQNEELRAAFARAWPLLDPLGLVAQLWSSPSFLRRAAPWLSDAEVLALQRDEPRAWTTADLPFLDAARRRIGDPTASMERRRRKAELAAEREEMSHVVDDLIAADDSEMLVMSMLRGQDFQNSLAGASGVRDERPDTLEGPFAHIVVDEAQELTDAEWRMLVARAPSRSFTIVGDRAQARHGFAESWQERLHRVGLDRVEIASLTVNYRTPKEVMGAAEPVIRAALPDANVPTSIRESGIPVRYATRRDLDMTLSEWLEAHAEGVACVIGDPSFVGSPRVRSLTPELAKGLEFDLVVLVEPDAFGSGIEGAVDRYVAMTRATQQLVVLTA